ncbi:hypothetical protein EVAR_7782_1 [Eumeta japonica]|uniref:Uncharacterized protein n=1 Tax=Eumeta variegata TaxID=151549 RepID=A0A4C1TK63_EUMVA|nr:hypothetical protein EVAR_7782_1 [Eumeta japonica]
MRLSAVFCRPRLFSRGVCERTRTGAKHRIETSTIKRFLFHFKIVIVSSLRLILLHLNALRFESIVTTDNKENSVQSQECTCVRRSLRLIQNADAVPQHNAE